jgi:quercetin dioxygenase-like cupin family protein
MTKHGKSFTRQGSVAAVLATAAVMTATPAHATPASGFTAVQTYKGAFPTLQVKGEKTGTWDVKIDTKANSDIYVVRNSIAIGGQSGWHSHPGPSLITVTLGEITAYESHDPLCQPKVYGAGEGFVDSGDHAHLLKNESGAAAETVAVQFLPVGATRRTDEPEPNNCNF